MTKIDGNSSVNQGIKGKFINREVYLCQSYLIDEILNVSSQYDTGLLTYDDIENLYSGFDKQIVALAVCPSCGTEVTEIDSDTGVCEECFESEPAEIFEWWLVSEYLYKELKNRKQPVMTDGQCFWWGRCTTGQGILLDAVITDICADMEILEGQTHDWSKYL